MRIIVGYDGSECARAALSELRRAGLPRQAEAQVISVAELWFPPPPPSSYETLGATIGGQDAKESGSSVVASPSEGAVPEALAETRLLGAEASRKLLEYFPEWTVSSHACTGSPAWEIVSRAELWNADLIAVGSHGRSTLGRLVLGSISHRVVAEAPCSVRVAKPSQGAERTSLRLVAGFDGSPGSEAALQSMAARSWPPQTEVLLVTAVDTLRPTSVGELIPPVRSAVHDYNEEQLAWANNMLAAAAGRLKSSGLAVTILAIPGDPKHVLVDEARRWSADSIFVGARGLNRISRFLLGSVSTAVVSRAHCSVEVVRG